MERASTSDATYPHGFGLVHIPRPDVESEEAQEAPHLLAPGVEVMA